MLDLCPRPRQDYRVSAKKALIRVESLKTEQRSTPLLRFFCVFISLSIRYGWQEWGVFARWSSLCSSSLSTYSLLPALAIESASGLINNDKETS